jgi:hypothetical protein
MTCGRNKRKFADLQRQRSRCFTAFEATDSHRAAAQTRGRTLACEVASRSESRQGFQLLAWADNGLQYSAVFDAAAQDLVELRNLLEAQARKEKQSGMRN